MVMALRAYAGLVLAVAALFSLTAILTRSGDFSTLLFFGGSLWGLWYLWFKLPHRERIRRLQHVKTLGDLLACTPREFERRVGDILVTTGYRNVRHIGGTGDLAADLLCQNQEGRIVVVQCKRYAPGNRVGSPDIQKFIGMMTVHHKAEVGIFITTSDFSQPAISLAKRHGISLLSGHDLTRLIASINGNEGSVAS